MEKLEFKPLPKLSPYIRDQIIECLPILDFEKEFDLPPNTGFNDFKRTLSLYAARGVYHIVLMNQAERVAKGQVPLEDFIEKYQIEFSDKVHEVFTANVEPVLEESGMFYWGDSKKPVPFFDGDDRNMFLIQRTKGKTQQEKHDLYTQHQKQLESATTLIRGEWSFADFQDPEKVTRALEYSKNLCQRSTSSAVDYLLDQENHGLVPGKLTAPFIELVKYYYSLTKLAI
jgi:hypothetical protein